jgi:hypothetical protein
MAKLGEFSERGDRVVDQEQLPAQFVDGGIREQAVTVATRLIFAVGGP